MHVLVVNCGSSSIKLDLLDPATGTRVKKASVERVGSDLRLDVDAWKAALARWWQRR